MAEVRSVVVGRFIGPVRPVIPLVAGAMGMQLPLFLAVNVSSALLWSPVYILPGYLLGAAVDARFSSAELLAAAIAVVAAMTLFAWLRHHFRS